jgi:two-component system, LytTR family, sensor kinase
MSRKNRIFIEVICHVLFWFIPTWLSIKYNLVTLGQQLSNEYAYMPFIANTLFNVLLVYSNIFLLFPAYTRKKLNGFQYASLIIIIVLMSGILKSEINNLFSWYYFSKIFSKIPFGELFFTELIIAAFFIVQSILYCAVKEWIKNNIVNRKLIEEKLTLELKYLKAQINPHFLFNTLNNLYSIALGKNDNETAAGLAKLSEIMRYMLNDVNENEISLDKEIDYLKSYIDLQKLRFSEEDDMIISFDIQRDTSERKIPPFLFIVFVENAFKHGINLKRHSFIHIKLENSKNVLKFTIRNSVHNKGNLNIQGVGFKNIKERLELLYRENYKLEIFNENDIFNVELEISLAS